MDAQTVRDFADLLAAVRRPMDDYLLGGELKGVACAAGTLTSRINNLKVICAAYEDREPNEKDRFELSSLARTLDWLGKDDYAARDFTGINLRLPATAFNTAHPDIAMPGEIDYRAAMIMLQAALEEIVLEGKPVALSA